MRQGLTDAKAANAAKLKAIENELDKKKQDALRKEFIDQDFEIMLKSVEAHSLCHEQQVEGLILFAERMKWPWINDVRDYAEEVYSSLRSGQVVPMHLHDWLFGITLPGQWFSFKIMTALILCTPSMNETIPGIAPYYVAASACRRNRTGASAQSSAACSGVFPASHRSAAGSDLVRPLSSSRQVATRMTTSTVPSHGTSS
jgi:hypothetical protein